MALHRHLARQLRKLGVQPGEAPTRGAWEAFLESVNRSYEDADRDRYMLERSIALSSLEMQELNARLAQERDQFAQFFRSAPAGMMRIELDGRLADLNPAFETIVWQTKGALTGRPLWSLANPEDEALLRTWFQAVAEQRHPVPIEVRFVHPDGENVLTNIGGALVRDERGRPQFAIAVVEDVTERSRLELKLRLSQKLESVGRLAAGIAHEINTPIQFVGDHASFMASAITNLLGVCDEYRALCDKAARQGLSDEDHARLRAQDEVRDRIRRVVPEAVEATLEGVSRVENIVRAMRTFAHPARGQRRNADVNAALRSTLTVAANELKYVADVTTDLEPLPPVPCYLSDLNQVFLNLLVNAAHAIADVVRGTGSKGKVHVRSYREGDEAVVLVSDTGGGIPAAIQSKIFDPFFTTKEVGKGTGQGLAIARSVVVEQHGGSLSFETELGEGTTFCVRLPLVVEPSDPIEEGL
jgi:PAS domain S-box-containing protein